MTTGAILVKLGSATSSTLSTNGTHTFNLTANGTELALDPTSQFNGDVRSIILKRYFAPAQEFNMQGEGFTITWNGQGGTRNRTFLGSECVINYIVKNDDEEAFIKSTLDNGYNYFLQHPPLQLQLFLHQIQEPNFQVQEKGTKLTSQTKQKNAGFILSRIFFATS